MIIIASTPNQVGFVALAYGKTTNIYSSPQAKITLVLKIEEEHKRLYIEVGHDRRTKFEYEEENCPVYDHQDRRWRHLNFFQHECYLFPV